MIQALLEWMSSFALPFRRTLTATIFNQMPSEPTAVGAVATVGAAAPTMHGLSMMSMVFPAQVAHPELGLMHVLLKPSQQGPTILCTFHKLKFQLLEHTGVACRCLLPASTRWLWSAHCGSQVMVQVFDAYLAHSHHLDGRTF
jgi:hypothetical protein